MDENTQFIMERMDKLEERLVKKIDDLQAFKNKIMGMAMIAGAVSSALIQAVFK